MLRKKLHTTVTELQYEHYMVITTYTNIKKVKITTDHKVTYVYGILGEMITTCTLNDITIPVKTWKEHKLLRV